MRPFPLPPSLFDIAYVIGKQPIHGSNGTIICTFIEKLCIDLVRRFVSKSFRI